MEMKAKDPDTCVYQKYLLHVSSWLLTACPCTLGRGEGSQVLVLIDTIQQLVQFGPLIACSSGAVEACVCLHAA